MRVGYRASACLHGSYINLPSHLGRIGLPLPQRSRYDLNSGSKEFVDRGHSMRSSEPVSPSTRTSLLSKVRNAQDHAAWREFETRYREMLVRFCRKRGLQHVDAEDVVQQVFVNLAKSLPGFIYDPARGRFRDYLFRCTRNVIWLWSRRPNGRPIALDSNVGTLQSTDEPSPEESALWHEEWVSHHYRLAMETVRSSFDPQSVEVFMRNVAGEGVTELAEAYGITETAVYSLRKRIRIRLQELVTTQVNDEDRIDGQPSTGSK